MDAFYSKPTVKFFYLLHTVPVLHFLLNSLLIIAACGLVECLWWQRLLFQLFPLVAIIIPFIAIYFQQKGKIYAGYLFALSMVYYTLLYFGQLPFFPLGMLYGFVDEVMSLYIFWLFLAVLVITQGYFLFKTTSVILTSSQQNKKTSPYHDLRIIIGISAIPFLLIASSLWGYVFISNAPDPTSESDCIALDNQEEANSCYDALAYSTRNFDLCAKISSISSRDKCYAGSGTPEGCAKIEEDKTSISVCLGTNSQYKLVDLVEPTYCDTAVNSEVCYFWFAIYKEDLTFCEKAENREECRVMVKTARNTCNGLTDECGPIPIAETVEIDPLECEKITLNSYNWDLYSFKKDCFTKKNINPKQRY